MITNKAELECVTGTVSAFVVFYVFGSPTSSLDRIGLVRNFHLNLGIGHAEEGMASHINIVASG